MLDARIPRALHCNGELCEPVAAHAEVDHFEYRHQARCEILPAKNFKGNACFVGVRLARTMRWANDGLRNKKRARFPAWSNCPAVVACPFCPPLPAKGARRFPRFHR